MHTFFSRLEIVSFLTFSFFIIPLSFCPGVVDPGLSMHFCLLALLIAVLAIVRCIRYTVFPQEQVQGIPTIFTIFCAGYCCICLASIIPSINKSESVFEIAKIFLFASYIWFASTIVRRCFDRIHSIAKAVTVSSLIIAILGIFEYWGVFHLLDNGWVGPGVTMISRNLLSSYLFLCLGFVLFVVVAARQRAWRFLGFLAYAAIIYIFLATRTRAVWLGCLGGLLCTIIITAALRFPLLFSLLRTQKKNIPILAILPFISLVAVSFLKPANSDLPSLAQRAATIVDPGFESNNQRLLLWRKTIFMSLGHPFLGVGAGNWKIVLPRYGIGDLLCPDLNFIEIRPYNDFLWVLAETGIFGLMLYGGLFLLSALFCVQSLRNARDRTIAFCSVLLLFTLIGFAIISFFDFPKERIEHLTLFGVILAVCASIGAASLKPFSNRFTSKVTGVFPTPPLDIPISARSEGIKQGALFTGGAGTTSVPCTHTYEPHGKRGQWQRHAFAAASLLCALACLWIGAVRLSGDINDATMRGLWKNREWQKAIAAANRASSVLYTMEPTSTPLRWYRGVANFKLGNIDQAFLDYSQAYAFHPWHLNVLNDLGTCYSLKGDQKRAIECYTNALAVSPFFEPTLINLAAVYYNGGQYDQAYKYITMSKSPHTDSRFESFFKIISQKANKRVCP